MLKVNKHFLELEDSYLFANIAHKVSTFKNENPDKKVISLGIGDVVLPLSEPVIKALREGVDDMAAIDTFKGYGPEQGYDFLREVLQSNYKKFSVELEKDEIFISDGAKSDLGNILNLFEKDNVVLIPDPVYPAYVDTNVMDGRKIVYMDSNIENGFLAMPDYNVKADIIYICSPNNPTGAVYNREQLQEWVNYAKEMNAVILFDAAYECFISDSSLPHSIYEIQGAKECAIEVCSLSKTAGFTGVRCGYTIVPKSLKFDDISLNKLWLRRQTTKFNGVPYIVQKAAAAVFSEEGMTACKKVIDSYKENARILGETLKDLGINYIGGENSPYIWLQCPNNMKSWDFFDLLLQEANIVGTPGVGFGNNGEGYFRLSCFALRENVIEAAERLRKLNFK